MTPEQEERYIAALESIAKNFARYVSCRFPERKREVTDATVTRIPSDEDRLREELGDTGESTTEEWLGLREKAFVEAEAKGAKGSG